MWRSGDLKFGEPRDLDCEDSGICELDGAFTNPKTRPSPSDTKDATAARRAPCHRPGT